MKKFGLQQPLITTVLTSALVSILSATAQAEDKDVIKIGVLQGFSGPIESLTPMMAKSAELAMKEVSASKALLDGKKLVPVRADSTCTDAAAATTAAERLVNSEKVVAIYGASCSGATTAVANNVSVPNGVPTISPSATSPALSDIEDKGYFFRTAPSDARQGQVLANIVMGKGIKEVAVTYTNNDYGKGFSESFTKAYEKLGGKITINASHEDGKADYSAEVAALSASGAQELLVIGYLDQGGKGIVQGSLDTGAFERFIFTDGMIGQSLIDAVGKELNGSFGTMPGGENEGSEKWKAVAKAGGIDPDGGPYRGESYDAAAIIALAIQAAGSTDKAKIQAKIMDVTNAPGEKIFPGDIAKGLQLLKEGKDVDYVGATNVEFNDVGEVLGSYKEMEIKDKKFEQVNLH